MGGEVLPNLGARMRHFFLREADKNGERDGDGVFGGVFSGDDVCADVWFGVGGLCVAGDAVNKPVLFLPAWLVAEGVAIPLGWVLDPVRDGWTPRF